MTECAILHPDQQVIAINPYHFSAFYHSLGLWLSGGCAGFCIYLCVNSNDERQAQGGQRQTNYDSSCG
jgi:hypothetical protein